MRLPLSSGPKPTIHLEIEKGRCFPMRRKNIIIHLRSLIIGALTSPSWGRTQIRPASTPLTSPQKTFKTPSTPYLFRGIGSIYMIYGIMPWAPLSGITMPLHGKAHKTKKPKQVTQDRSSFTKMAPCSIPGLQVPA